MTAMVLRRVSSPKGSRAAYEMRGVLVAQTQSATRMSLTFATPAPPRRGDFFDWSSISARIEKHQSAVESEWTVEMRYKRWTSLMAWDAADNVLSRKCPTLHSFLRLGNALLRVVQHASPSCWGPGNIVGETFLFITSIVTPTRFRVEGLDSLLQMLFTIESISAVIMEIDDFDILEGNLRSPGVIGDLPLLKGWYEDAINGHSPPSLLSRASNISLKSNWNGHEIFLASPGHQDICGKMFLCAHEHWALEAVKLVGIFPDLTQELSLRLGPCGHGASCDVYLAKWNSPYRTTEMVAVKAFRIPDQGPSDYVTKLGKRMKDELDIWAPLDHPHILPLYGMHWIGGVPGLVTPWCKNGDLSQYVRDLCGPAKSAIALELMEQVALGLEYLHTRSPAIVHGDLKGANILISEDGQALICDFGLAAIEAAAAETSFMLLSGTSAKGTYRWMAHELVLYDDARLTRESDIWAFGCVLLEVLSGRVPYYEKKEAVQVILAISQGEIPTRPPGIHNRVWKLMQHCWQLVPSDRPCAGCILGDMRAFLESDELERWMSGQTTDASPV